MACRDINQDGTVDLQDRLLNRGFVDTGRDEKRLKAIDDAFVNRAILYSWPFFSLYLLSQPWLSNYTNKLWFDYSANYTVYARNGTTEVLPEGGQRPGMCDTPAEDFYCTDGQNFTELVLKYRGPNKFGQAVGCGCGQGVLGEGLCPMTSYGYTLSDFVSTEPGIAAMLGLGFFPLYGTWRNTMIIDRLAKPGRWAQFFHLWSMGLFQISYICWGMASDCIFPVTHAVLTVVFLGSFFAHWVITALICIACMGLANIESVVTLWVAFSAISVMSIGAIPRTFLTLNSVLGTTFFPNLNYGLGSYAFWFAEASGLSLTFGAYPMIILAVKFFPDYADLNQDGDITHEERELFRLNYDDVKKSSVVREENAQKQQPVQYSAQQPAYAPPAPAYAPQPPAYSAQPPAYSAQPPAYSAQPPNYYQQGYAPPGPAPVIRSLRPNVAQPQPRR